MRSLRSKSTFKLQVRTSSSPVIAVSPANRASGALLASVMVHGLLAAGIWWLPDLWRAASPQKEPPRFDVALSEAQNQREALLAEAYEPAIDPPVEPPAEVEPEIQPMVEVVESRLEEEPIPSIEAMPGPRPWRPQHLRFDQKRAPLSRAPQELVQPSEVAAEVSPEATPSASAQAEQTVVVLSPQRDPKQSAPPDYPRLARRYGWEGTTEYLVQINPQGRATSMVLVQSSGHDLLDEAAKNAVLGWVFHPATENGQAVAGELLVPIRFHLTPK